MAEPGRDSPRAFSLLLYALLGLLVVNALVAGHPRAGLLVDALLTGVLAAAALSVARSPRHLVIALVVGLPAVAVRWARYGVEGPEVQVAAILLTIAYFGFIAWILLEAVLLSPRVSLHVIQGAICVYLLFGIVFALVFGLLEALQPGSFSELGEPVTQHHTIAPFIYYSFVTITTLGYGDVLPLTPIARTLAYIEAILGQVYIAVLVAGLVGRYLTHSAADD